MTLENKVAIGCALYALAAGTYFGFERPCEDAIRKQISAGRQVKVLGGDVYTISADRDDERLTVARACDYGYASISYLASALALAGVMAALARRREEESGNAPLSQNPVA